MLEKYKLKKKSFEIHTHETLKMSDLDQFADLELSKEDREQIFEPPTDRQQHPADPSVPR